MNGFVGRLRELDILSQHLDDIRNGHDRDRPGNLLMVRGRRRVGKSRLVEEFCAASGTPSIYFTASRSRDGELALLIDEIARSAHPNAARIEGLLPTTWDAAFRVLADIVDDTPTTIVIDEFPYLLETDPGIAATLQAAWDRTLSRRPVLLILIGSDLTMMEHLDHYGQPLHQRGTAMVIGPFTPAETADAIGIDDPVAAIGAHLVTGGLPLICRSWRRHETIGAFIRRSLDDPTSPLIVSAERILAAEWPASSQASIVLHAIGDGHRTFANIARAAGGLRATSLTRSLDTLIDSRIVTRDLPLSTAPSREARYRITDPYLTLWLRHIGPHLDEIERGRGDRVARRITDDWPSWRGRAVEPIVRDALVRRTPPGLDHLDDRHQVAVGAWWTRTNSHEIDIVAGDRHPTATHIGYAGTIKWRTRNPVTPSEVAHLRATLAHLPGASPDTPIIAVCPAGIIDPSTVNATVDADWILARR